MNNMQLYQDKFEVMNYTLNRSKPLRDLPFTAEYYIYYTSDGTAIDPSDQVRDFGVMLSNDSKWSLYVGKIVEMQT